MSSIHFNGCKMNISLKTTVFYFLVHEYSLTKTLGGGRKTLKKMSVSVFSLAGIILLILMVFGQKVWKSKSLQVKRPPSQKGYKSKGPQVKRATSQKVPSQKGYKSKGPQSKGLQVKRSPSQKGYKSKGPQSKGLQVKRSPVKRATSQKVPSQKGYKSKGPQPKAPESKGLQKFESLLKIKESCTGKTLHTSFIIICDM